MTPAQVALVLDQLGVAFSKEIPAEALSVWAPQLSEIPDNVGILAVDLLVATEEFFPTVAMYRKYVGEAHRVVARERDALPPEQGGPDPRCSFCRGHGWGEGTPNVRVDKETGERHEDATVRPCENCDPVAYQTWLNYKDEIRRKGLRSHPRQSDREPSTLIDAARDVLKAADAPPEIRL